MSEISQLLREGPADSALAFRAADEIERLTPYVEAFRREETRADKLAQQVDELREQLADGGEEFQSLMRVNNGLREQIAHTEADFEACNEISCRRWEEIQRLREQLVTARRALEPFAKAFEAVPERDLSVEGIFDLKIERVLYLPDQPSIGDLRAAKTALTDEKGDA